MRVNTHGVRALHTRAFHYVHDARHRMQYGFKCHWIISQSLRGGVGGRPLNALSLRARRCVWPGGGDAFLEGRCGTKGASYAEGRPSVIPSVMRLKQRLHASGLKQLATWGMTRRNDWAMAWNATERRRQ